jgi:uncharacterized protein YdhG (YjbR/CyaY superfamily)
MSSRGLAGPHCVSTQTTTVDDYIATFPDDVQTLLQRVRDAIHAALPAAEERIRYGMPAVMLDERYALHFAGWTRHLGLYPVSTLPAPLEAEIAPYRTHKDSVRFPYADPISFDLIERVAGELGRMRGVDRPGD